MYEKLTESQVWSLIPIELESLKKRTRCQSFSLSVGHGEETMWGHSKKAAIYKPGKTPPPKAVLLVPGSWTFSLQN